MPTVIFREMRRQNPDLQGFRLANQFADFFNAEIDGWALHAIVYWHETRDEGGYTDDELDEILLKALNEAGVV